MYGKDVRGIERSTFIINKKIISFEEFQVAGHFLLNKIIHAYHNPDRVLCNIRMERQYNEFWNSLDISQTI